MKAVITKDAFLRYPDHSLPFHIFTDAYDLQLGAFVIQDKVPVVFYSRNGRPNRL